MTHSDLLQRFIFENAPVRGELIHLNKSFQTIINQHVYPPPLRKLLGEALCVAGLLSAIIKFNGRLTVQFRGKGKLKLLLAQCDHQFHLRGLAKWEGDLDYQDLMSAFQEGVLVIMLDSTIGKGSYQGIVSWRGNSLVESIEGYFKDSEQLATKLWLTVNETCAAGLLIQVMPESGEMPENELLTNHWKRIVDISSHLNMQEMLLLEDQSFLLKAYPTEDIRVFPTIPLKFQCTCNRKKGQDAILLLGKKEAEEELANKHSLVVTCDFCNKEYIYDKIDVAKIFKDNDKPPSIHLH